MAHKHITLEFEADVEMEHGEFVELIGRRFHDWIVSLGYDMELNIEPYGATYSVGH